MIALDYFYWWYTKGFLRFLKYLKVLIVILADNFSVKVLIKTFFQPWKRDMSSTKGLSLDRKLKVWGWNLIARAFGMVIKSITFFIFLIIFLILIFVEIILIITWLLYPLVILGGIGYIFYRLFS
ncbi:MAG: hypothetical protein HQ538_03955 [Parcubacteria group bacterium]|nr:hypothetical protein [Parcubacteria group bacterium]